MAISCSYYLEPVDTGDLPRRFLEAFAAILAHSNYAPVLDVLSRVSAHCGLCAVTCPVYEASGEERDIPCHRSELLLKVYRRYFTAAVGPVRAPPSRGAHQHDGRGLAGAPPAGCKPSALGIDHGMITHLGRWSSRVDRPKAQGGGAGTLDGRRQHVRSPGACGTPTSSSRTIAKTPGDEVSSRSTAGGVRLLPGRFRLPSGAGHAHGKRSRPDRGWRLLDHRLALLRRDQLRPLLLRPDARPDLCRRRGGSPPGARHPDRRCSRLAGNSSSDLRRRPDAPRSTS
jgi:hypothetical protein